MEISPGCSLEGLILKLKLQYFGLTHIYESRKMVLMNLFAEQQRASLLAQMVKNLPAMEETQVRSLSWEDLLEKEIATHFSIPAWEIP